MNDKRDIGIRPETLLKRMGESEFSLRNRNTPLSSLAAFEASEHADDWREVVAYFWSDVLARLLSKTTRNATNGTADTITASRASAPLPPSRQPHTVEFPSDSDDPQDRCRQPLSARDCRCY